MTEGSEASAPCSALAGRDTTPPVVSGCDGGAGGSSVGCA